MAGIHVPTGRAAHTVERRARGTATSRWTAMLTSLGYAAKGVVYLIIGGLAVQATVGAGGRITDLRGAIVTIYNHPFGVGLLGIVTVGLCGFALWSFVQAWLDTEGKGSDAPGIAARLGYAAGGVSNALLAITAAHLVLGAGSGGRSSDGTAQDWTARLLAYPFGPLLVVVAGGAVLGAACYLFYKAYSARFRARLNLAGLRAAARDGAITLGRCGYAAIGVVVSVIGLFLIVAALRHNPHEAKGLGGALRELAAQPFGPALLGLVAAGMLIYGVYSVAEARYRRLGTG